MSPSAFRPSLLLLSLLLACAGSAFAQQPFNNPGVSWSYFDIGLQYVSPDHSALDNGAGAAIRGSGEINDNWHVFLGWTRTALEGEEPFLGANNIPGTVILDDDVDRYHIGIGYNLPVAATTDLFFRVAYERVGSADFVINTAALVPVQSGKIEATDGFSGEVGVRSAFTPRFEAGASIRHVALDDVEVSVAGATVDVPPMLREDSTTSAVLYAQYRFSNGWGIIGEGELNSDYNAVFLGARLSY